MIAGTDGWIREKKSRNRFSNSGGEALSCGGSLLCHRVSILPAAIPAPDHAGMRRDRGAPFRKGRKSRRGPFSKKAAICAFAPGGVHDPVT